MPRSYELFALCFLIAFLAIVFLASAYSVGWF